ncbi:MAG TPA: DUF1801 domain-containing protein [Bacteroidia bacterium]|nr:DUF1801 domain-containing protein [Bacteroidia bacterium]HNT80050.1 DUF1801 domain-containing protein [Bacteroidia bacterium]
MDNDSKKEDCKVLIKLMKDTTGMEPKIWGDNFIIGFGKYSYQRKGNKELFEWFNIGFAPRKNKITIYLTFDISKYESLTKKLGKCKWGKGCLYINKLDDVDLKVLKQLIEIGKNSQWYSNNS